jgi:hypothetical protein
MFKTRKSKHEEQLTLKQVELVSDNVTHATPWLCKVMKQNKIFFNNVRMAQMCPRPTDYKISFLMILINVSKRVHIYITVEAVNLHSPT